MTVRIGLTSPRIREDEKFLLVGPCDRGHEMVKIDVRDRQFRIGEVPEALVNLDLGVDRWLATRRSRYRAEFRHAYGIPVANSPQTVAMRADRGKTSIAFEAADVPTPATGVSFTIDAAPDSIERRGYPVFYRRSWGLGGRSMVKMESRGAADAVREQEVARGRGTPLDRRVMDAMGTQEGAEIPEGEHAEPTAIPIRWSCSNPRRSTVPSAKPSRTNTSFLSAMRDSSRG